MSSERTDQARRTCPAAPQQGRNRHLLKVSNYNVHAITMFMQETIIAYCPHPALLDCTHPISHVHRYANDLQVNLAELAQAADQHQQPAKPAADAAAAAPKAMGPPPGAAQQLPAKPGQASQVALGLVFGEGLCLLDACDNFFSTHPTAGYGIYCDHLAQSRVPQAVLVGQGFS